MEVAVVVAVDSVAVFFEPVVVGAESVGVVLVGSAVVVVPAAGVVGFAASDGDVAARPDATHLLQQGGFAGGTAEESLFAAVVDDVAVVGVGDDPAHFGPQHEPGCFGQVELMAALGAAHDVGEARCEDRFAA